MNEANEIQLFGTQKRLNDITIDKVSLYFDIEFYKRGQEAYSAEMAQMYNAFLRMSEELLKQHEILIAILKEEHAKLTVDVSDPKGVKERINRKLGFFSYMDGFIAGPDIEFNLQRRITQDDRSLINGKLIIAFLKEQKVSIIKRVNEKGVSAKAKENLIMCNSFLDGLIQNYTSVVKIIRISRKMQQEILERVRKHST